MDDELIVGCFIKMIPSFCAFSVLLTPKAGYRLEYVYSYTNIQQYRKNTDLVIGIYACILRVLCLDGTFKKKNFP